MPPKAKVNARSLKLKTVPPRAKAMARLKLATVAIAVAASAGAAAAQQADPTELGLGKHTRDWVKPKPKVGSPTISIVTDCSGIECPVVVFFLSRDARL